MRSIGCIVLGVFLLVGSIQAQVEVHLEKEIQKIITFDAEIDFEQTPGMWVGIVWGDSSYLFNYGVASLEDSLPLTPGHLFELGEYTQVFTAALSVKLAEEGYIDLDSSLTGYLGIKHGDPALEAITLRQCLHHTSGLPRYPLDFGEKEISSQDPYSGYTKEDLLHFLKEYSMAASTPPAYNFSNINYALVEIALEKALGMPFEELMYDKMLNPLGLSQTHFYTPQNDQALYAQGYNAAARPVPLWSPASHQGAFGLRSNALDMLSWMQYLLAPPPELASVFSELYRKSVPTGIRKNTHMGMGWHLLYPKKRRRVLVHTGSTSGYMAYMALVPETQTGVFILANSPYGTKGLGFLVLRMLNNNWKK